MTLTVALDLDGVMYPLPVAVSSWAAEKGAYPPLPTEPSSWDFWTELGLSDADFAALLEAFAEDGGYNLCPPIPEALEGVVTLFDAGFDIVAVSSRPPSRAVEVSTYRWIADWFLPFRAVMLGPTAKLEVEADVVVDDNPADLALLADLGEACGLLLDRPWNQGVDDFCRVSWAELPSLLDVVAEAVAGIARGERGPLVAEALEEILEQNA